VLLAQAHLSACRRDFRGIEHRYLATHFRRSQVTLTGHTGMVQGVAVSPDGSRIVSGGDRTVRIWDARTGECLRVLTGHKGVLTSVAISPDGTRIVSASKEQVSSGKPGEIKLWELASGREVCSITESAGPVTSVCFSPDGRHFLSAVARVAKVWEAATGRLV